MGEPDADFDKLLGRAGRAPGQDRRRRGLGPRAHLRHRHGRPPPAAGRRRRHDAVGRGAPPGGPVPAAAVQARPAAPRRAHQPPRRRVGGLAGAHPPGVSGHRGGRHPRPLLPRQRGRLDPRAGPGGRHPLGGQLLVVAGAEAGPTGRRAEGRPVPPARPSSGSSSGSGCRRGPARARARPASTPTTTWWPRPRRPSAGPTSSRSPSRRAPPRRPGGRRRGAGQGVRRPPAHRRPVVPPPAGRASWG